ncbi:MAG: type II secretion system protein [bacterium]
MFKKIPTTKKLFKNKRGFTLIELLVATSIFVIVMVVALSTLLAVNNASKRSQALRSAMDNLNFAMENMSRNIRYGYAFGCVSTTGSVNFNANCSLNVATSNPIMGSSGVVFKLYNNATAATDYYLYQMNNSTSNNYIERCIAPGGGSYVCAPITSTDLNITTLRFAVYGATTSDGYQPGVFAYIEGTAKVGKEQSPFKIQTFFTQRQYEQ